MTGPTLAAGPRPRALAAGAGRGRDDGPVTPDASLLSAEGQELLAWLSGRDVSPDQALRLAEELRGRYPPGLVAAALTQQALRTAGRSKFSLADSMLFTRAGLEQASSDLTAGHSARRFAAFGLVADLCCGIGGNLAALAGAAEHVLAVDRDPTALLFAMRNALVHGVAGKVTPLCADVRDLVLPAVGSPGTTVGSGRRVDGIFIDPARRTGDRRLRAGASEPPLAWCFALADRVPAVGIKAAPGLPHELVPPGWETEFVATGRNLKEALLWSPALATASRRATILPGGHTLTTAPGPPVPVAAPGEYLLDPSPAVTRAGLVEELARDLGAWKIDPMIAFLAADREISTPFGRTLRVLESMPWNERQAARRLRALGIGAASIRRRGLAGDVQEIHRRLDLSGERSATIVLTRRDGKPWGLICTDVPASGP
jgi:SAM-dependent methyltransferase